MSKALARPPLGWVLLAVVAVCVVFYFYFDLPILRASLVWSEGQSGAVWRIVTAFGNGWPYVAGLPGLCLWAVWRSRRPGRRERRNQLELKAWRFGFVLAAMLVSGVIHHVIKIGLGRVRPRLLLEDGLYGLNPLNFTIAENGFPSGHTQTVWSVFFALWLLFPRYWPLYLAVAVPVSLSRVALQAHYPSDVIFGAYLGIATAVLLKRYFLDPKATLLLIGDDAHGYDSATTRRE